MTLKFILFIVIGLCGTVRGCTELTAVNGTVGSFDSHDEYGEENYGHENYKCWIIAAGDGYAIQAWTDSFDLEREYDFMNIYCGHDGRDGVIGEYHGSNGISPTYPVHTNGSEMFVEFITDHSVSRGGFRFNYTAVGFAEADGGDCIDWDEWEDSHERHTTINKNKHSGGLGGAVIAGIVFGVLFAVIILGAIAGCVVCFIASLKTRQKRLVGVQNYPLQMYPMAQHGMTPVGGGSMDWPGMSAAPACGMATQQELYGNERKVHPDQMRSGHNPMSPPPGYEPTETTGHM